jgi:hypothetical protein
MTVLGIRCWPEKFSYVAAKGNSERPTLVAAETLHSPQGMNRACFLGWVFRETQALVTKHAPRACRIKACEPNAQKNAHSLERSQVEGVVHASLYQSGCRDIGTLYKQQIKISVGFAGQASKVSEALAGTAFQELAGKDEEEAALAAWSALGAD